MCDIIYLTHVCYLKTLLKKILHNLHQQKMSTTKTTIIVFHINNKYSIGFHKCIGSPAIYYLQSAGNVYECFARYNKIVNKDTVIDILIENIIPELVHVVPNGDYIENWKSSLKIDDFLNAKIDEIDIVHENYNIKHYC